MSNYPELEAWVYFIGGIIALGVIGKILGIHGDFQLSGM